MRSVRRLAVRTAALLGQIRGRVSELEAKHPGISILADRDSLRYRVRLVLETVCRPATVPISQLQNL
jgi:hypothetical protein